MEDKRVPRVPIIFINYRHDESSEFARRLHETLSRRFGARHVFWDSQAIEGGADFSEAIRDALNSSIVLVAVVGRNWLARKSDGKRRLDEAHDYVRSEIASALGQVGTRVMPVLVEHASIPDVKDLPEDLKRLATYHWIRIRELTWQADTKELIKTIAKDFQRYYPYSPVFSAIAGMISGLVVGAIYYNQHDVGLDRIALHGIYGLVAAVVLSGLVKFGIMRLLKPSGGSPYAKIIGGTLGGVLGGILMAILGGFAFAWLPGGAGDPFQITLTVALCGMLITGGFFLPALKAGWTNASHLGLTLLVTTAILGMILRWLFQKDLWGSFVTSNLNQSDSAFSLGVLILGLTSGLVLGIEVGAVLFVYELYLVPRRSVR